MRPRHAALFAALFLCATVARAHRLDEYLQATLLTVSHDQFTATVRLMPGAALARNVIAGIDTDRDGTFSPAEQHSYAERILAANVFTLDDKPLHPVLISESFPAPAELLDGNGVIRLELRASLPPGGPDRSLALHTVRGVASVFLVNALTPQDPAITLTGQVRNQNQSNYVLSYHDSRGMPPHGHWKRAAFALAGLLLALVVALLLRRHRICLAL